jgi:peptidoglycan/LPS O-acetylase OafA/YrhL
MKSYATSIGQGRILPLDGLRGIIALSVLTFHFQCIYPLESREFIHGGYVGSDLFFLISGVVLTHVYEEKIRSGAISFREFFVHRLARLYPLYFLVLLAILAIDLVSFRFFPHSLHSENGHFAVASPPLLTGLLNFLCLQGMGFNTAFPWNLPTWSISVELAVNFIWFWLLMRCRGSAPFVALAVLAGLILANNTPILDAWTHNVYGIVNLGVMRGLMDFSIGCLLCRHVIRGGEFSRYGAVGANAAAASAVALAALTFRYADSGPASWGLDYATVIVGFPVLIVTSLHSKTFLNRFLMWKPVLWLGEISYSIYLLHWVILRIFSRLGEKIPSSVPLTIHGSVYLVLVLLCSWGTYTLVEKPFQKRVRAWLSRQDVATAVAEPNLSGTRGANAPLEGKATFFIERPLTG